MANLPKGTAADIWPADVKVLLEAQHFNAAARGDKQGEFAIAAALAYIQQLEARLVETGRVCFVANHADYPKNRMKRELEKATGLCMAINPVIDRSPLHAVQ
jgi:hypothetical protein